MTIVLGELSYHNSCYF